MEITPGQVVEVQKSNGEWIELRAVSVQQGYDFPVVVVCDDAEWEADGPNAEGIAWPESHVREVSYAGT